MKKLLVLMLVLGMASMASASLTISVNGEQEPVDSEYNLLPSEELVLDLYANMPLPEDYRYYTMVVDVAVGTIGQGSLTTYGASLSGTEVKDNLYYGGYYLNKGITDAGLNPADYGGGSVGYVGDTTGAAIDGVVIDLIPFHCEGIGDAVIELWTAGADGVYSLTDTVTIHQIPEPMTMVLLGLGGLLLRRRK